MAATDEQTTADAEDAAMDQEQPEPAETPVDTSGVQTPVAEEASEDVEMAGE